MHLQIVELHHICIKIKNKSLIERTVKVVHFEEANQYVRIVNVNNETVWKRYRFSFSHPTVFYHNESITLFPKYNLKTNRVTFICQKMARY